MVSDTTAPRERQLLAKAYRDNGDLGAARYVEGGHDLTPDTRIALLAIRDALSTVDREAIARAVCIATGDDFDAFGQHWVNTPCAEAADAILSLLHPIDGDRFSAKAGDSEHSGAAVNDPNSESPLSQTGDEAQEPQISAGPRATVSDDISYAGAEIGESIEGWPTIWEEPAGKGYPCFERPMTLEEVVAHVRKLEALAPNGDPTTEMLDEAVRIMRGSTNPDHGLALEVWNAMRLPQRSAVTKGAGQ